MRLSRERRPRDRIVLATFQQPNRASQMGIFGAIMNKIFHHGQAAAQPAASWPKS